MKPFKFIITLMLLTFVHIFGQFANDSITTNDYDQSETTIAISPLNPNILLAAWNDFRTYANRSEPGYAFSTNDGQTWSEDILVLPQEYIYGVDPSVAFDRFGNAFYCCMVYSDQVYPGPIFVFRTTNFQSPVWNFNNRVSVELTSQDKPWMTVDNTENYPGRLYFSWTDLTGAIKFRYSSDHGASFGDEQTIDELPGNMMENKYIYPWYLEGGDDLGLSFLQGSMPTVAPNGYVYVIWMDGNTSLEIPDYLRIKKSTDGGDNFGDELTVCEFISQKLSFIFPFMWNFPSLAIDRLTGNLYVAYMDFPNISSVDSHIKFTRSTNEGDDWSTPIIIGDLGITSDMQYFPSISVDNSGRISVFFANYSSPNTDTYITESYDEGNTFLAPLKVTTQGSDPPINLRHHEYHGVFNKDGGNSYCVWNDYRNGNADIYFSIANSLNYYAAENKSVNHTATGVNGQRKITKDTEGDYHFVFASGGNIYYRKSTDGGTTWSSPVNVSNEGGKNDFPSITTHGDYLFVTYQEYNGVENNQNNYIIKGKWKLISSDTWSSMIISNPSVSLSQFDEPFPVIVTAENVDDNYNSILDAPEVMIAFPNNNGMYHVNLFYVESDEETPERYYTQLGSIHQIPTTSGGYENPSITVNGLGEIMLTCNYWGNIYAFTTTGGNWSAIPSSVFRSAYIESNAKSSVTSDATNYFHVSWHGEYWPSSTMSILHKKISTSGGLETPITEFRNNQYMSFQPSTFGHLDANGGVTLYWYTADDKDIKKVVNDGTRWDHSTNDFIPSIQTDGILVSSIDKDAPDDFAYCWTSTGDAPYYYNTCIGCEENQGDFGGTDSLKTYRRAEFSNTGLDAILSLQLGNFKLKDINNNGYPLEPEELDANFTFQDFNEALNTLFCDTIPRSNLYRRIAFEYEAVFKNLLKIKANNSNNVSLKFKLIDRATGNILYTSNSFTLPLDSTKRTISGNLAIPFNGLNQQYDLSVKLILEGVAEEYLNQTENINLVNTYLSGSQNLGKRSETQNNITQITEYRLEQNYPNPFNPTTQIRYSVAEDGLVTLKVYDVLGREVAALVNEEKFTGNYDVKFDASNLSSGIYFYQLKTKDYVDTKKMILIK